MLLIVLYRSVPNASCGALAVKVFLTDWYVMMREGREGYNNL
jgi:hypothetical protein